MIQVYQIVLKYNYIELVLFVHKLIRFQGFLGTALCIETIDLIMKRKSTN